jgi:hypothetical protein
MMFDFLKLKTAIVGVGEHMAGLRSEKEALKRQREELAAAPGTKDDMISIFHDHIDQTAAKYSGRLQRAIEQSLNHGRDMHTGPNGRPQLGLLSLARENYSTPCSPLDIESSLFFVIGPAMKAAVADAINAMEWPADAQPLAGRAAEISKLEKKIAVLEQSEQDLRRDAAAAGVVV